MPPHASIRPLTPADLPAAQQLSEAAGWNQTPDDWRRALQLAPHGCFGRIQNGRLAGTVTTCVFDDIGWIGMMLVDAECRRQGHGKALMQHALEYLDRQEGVVSVWLDATDLGRPLYELLGFSAVENIRRFAGRFSSKKAADDDASNRQIGPLQRDEISQLIAFDASILGVDRSRLLQMHCNRSDNPVVVLRQADATLSGYCSQRPGRVALQIGPAAARTETDLLTLLAHVLRKQADHDVFLDIASSLQKATAWLESQGITPVRCFTRMCRGPVARGAPLAASAWLASGPEKG